MLKNITSVFFMILFAASLGLAQDQFGQRGDHKIVLDAPVQNYTPEMVIKFSDDFNAANDEASLNARGWVTVNVDGGGTTSWFTGNPTVFVSYEGPDSGYVAENYNGANGFYINQWLISPEVTVGAGDTLSFWHMSGGGSWDDSLVVHISSTAGTTPADFDISFPIFRAAQTDWTQYIETFPSAGTVRFAIQYLIYDGGPSGTHSNYVGIDLAEVFGTDPIPVELSAFTASVSETNVQLNWTTATETNNKGFQLERSLNDGQFVAVDFINGAGTTTEGKEYSYVDRGLESGTYTYRLKQIDYNGAFSFSQPVVVEVNAVPDNFDLSQNYPNPFNPSTAINFALPVDSKVMLKVHNIIGQEVATLVNGSYSAGVHKVNFDASNLTSGLYIYTISAAGIDGSSYNMTRKMMLTK